MRKPASISLTLSSCSRSRKQYIITETAPISSACVASQTRWLVMRCSSAMSTRMSRTRCGISMPSSRSTARQKARLFDCAPR